MFMVKKTGKCISGYSALGKGQEVKVWKTKIIQSRYWKSSEVIHHQVL
ncbi:hypothetical protein DORLON_02626 [Dorea longicatena DSM 13814]|uniref:Uncharacterized protein n=1 Tax=Dorea longicatena DSM 13814 TaxID=411462 RepID=A6BJY1_9FIRM|nr:hypothetical protein DORLON_02626 [Dorea longicatena DSM 13814]